MVSIIIAAHNEELVLGETLDALLTGTRIPIQVIVVANGCSDNTAEVARKHEGVEVIDLEDGGKALALNAGDAAAHHFPRIYLDADIIVPPGGVEALVKALETTGIVAAVPGREVITAGRPWPVRAYSRIHRELPIFREGLFGRGMIALSAEGRARFNTFPLMVADDLFLDAQFTVDERTCVEEVRVRVDTPPSTSELLGRLVRVRRGSAAMRKASLDGDVAATVRGSDRWAWLRDVVLKDPRLIPSGVVYAAITVLAAARARRGPLDTLDWGRGKSPRATPGKADVTRIGFLGIQCDTANLGLAALAYAAVDIMAEAVPGPAEFVMFSVNSPDALERMTTHLGLVDKRVRAVPFRHKRPAAMIRSIREIAACNVVLDFTGGDSFSDIYGSRRLLRKLLHKQFVLWTGTPLVLAPQTYGPLESRLLRPWFRHVVKHAAEVFTRDAPSVEFLGKLSGREVHLSTDVAVALGWTSPVASPEQDGPLRVGLNVSGLLWAGGYTGDNQFGLATDYRDYCDRLVGQLLDDGHQVDLVPHVLMRPWEDPTEDDVSAAEELRSLHPGATLAPRFQSPVEAKSHIAGLDVLVGSRMHATIAALTAGIPTVPAAYSRKFEGFFGSLGYPVVVDLVSSTTDEALEETLRHIRDHAHLRGLAMKANARAVEQISVFTDRLNTSMIRW